jgi:transcriptional regulator with XRE-family HTH domain
MEKSFGGKLRDLRGTQSQAAIAAVFGIAQQTYGGWEKDQRKPDLTELCRICTHYSVSADWLLGLKSAVDKRAADAEAKLRAAHDAFFKVTEAVNLLGQSLQGTENERRRHE